jgi:hypothetical protein
LTPEDSAVTAARSRVLALLVAAVAAGTLSTIVQVLLWVAFVDDWPAMLARDTRLAAALLLGTGVLPPPATFDSVVIAAATAVHGALSLAYVGVVAWLVGPRPPATAALIGALFGIALYVVNMYGFTLVLPWFAAARDWITVVAHVAFGVSGALAYRALR